MAEEKYSIEIEEEFDGNWVAEIIDFPVVMMAYGLTKQEAIANVEASAFKVIAERVRQTKIGMTRLTFGVLE
jgi:predicted RNase H-like HicB family nuclease